MITGSLDPKNEFSYLFPAAPAKSQTNNTGTLIGDLTGFEGKVAVVVSIGTKTAGDSDGAISITALASATNNISNGTNAGISGSVSTSNNASGTGEISVDTRGVAGKYLFWSPTVTGTNSPAYPIGIVAVGVKQVQ